MKTGVALVTGGGRGIGRATALALGARGTPVIVAARSREQVEATAAAILSAGGTAEAIVADVAREEDVARIFDRAHQALGLITLLVNNAGTLARQTLDTVTVEAFDRTMNVNVRGAFLCARLAFRDMVAAGGGRIVNIASLSGVAGVEKFPGLSPYVISKFGVVGLTESLAVEGRPHNIRSICLAPGAVETELLHRALPGLRASATAEDIARLVLFLLSDAAAPLGGLTLPLFSNAP